jgi:hypothetical protein
LIPPIPAKRRPKRYAYQFYEDQVQRLRHLNMVLRLQAPVDDDVLTLADMARDAFDTYISSMLVELGYDEERRDGTRMSGAPDPRPAEGAAREVTR